MMGNRSAIGIDFGRDTVKLVRAERRRGGKIVFTHAALLRLPGEPEEALAVAKRWIESLDLPNDPCVIGLPARSIITKSFEMEAADPRTAAQAAALEVQKLRKLTPEDFVYDVKETASSRSDTRKVLLFVVRPDVLDALLDKPSAMGLDVMDVVPAPVALCNLVRHFLPYDPGAPTVLLDVGHKTTELSVGAANGLRFVRSFDIGIGGFTNALAEGGGLSLAQAQERLQKDPDVFDNGPSRLAELLKAWHGEIGLSLDLYRDRFPEAAEAPHHFLVGGGGAHIAGLSTGLTQRFSLKPLEFPLFPLPGDIADPSVYALAAGLALTPVDRNVSRVSLSTAAMKARMRKRQDRVFMMAAVTFLMIAGIAMVTDMQRERAFEQKSRDATERQSVAVRQLQERLTRLQQENRLLLDTLRPVYRALENRVALEEMIKAVGDAKKTTDWFVSIAAMPEASLPGTDQAGAPKTNAAVSPLAFLVRGYTPDAAFYSVRTMIDQLRKHPRVVNADLLDESALTLTDPLSTHWAPLNGIPFALAIRTTSPKSLSLPPADVITAEPSAVQEQLIGSLRGQEYLTRSVLSAWDDVVKRCSTFKTRDDLFDLSPQSDVAFIDFRVALQETRHKLRTEAKAKGIPLPFDIGLGEAALKDKEVRNLLFQLGAIHKWVEVALDCKVKAILEIEPLDPVAVSAGSQVMMEQYPLRVAFQATLPTVMAMLRDLGQEQHFMIVKKATLIRPDCRNPDVLEVTLDVAALEFPEPPDAATFASVSKQP